MVNFNALHMQRRVEYETSPSCHTSTCSTIKIFHQTFAESSFTCARQTCCKFNGSDDLSTAMRLSSSFCNSRARPIAISYPTDDFCTTAAHLLRSVSLAPTATQYATFLALRQSISHLNFLYFAQPLAVICLEYFLSFFLLLSVSFHRTCTRHTVHSRKISSARNFFCHQKLNL